MSIKKKYRYNRTQHHKKHKKANYIDVSARKYIVVKEPEPYEPAKHIDKSKYLINDRNALDIIAERYRNEPEHLINGKSVLEIITDGYCKH